MFLLMPGTGCSSTCRFLRVDTVKMQCDTHTHAEGIVHRLGQRVASEPDRIESPYIVGPPPVLIVPMPMAQSGACDEGAESETGTDDQPEEEEARFVT